MSATDLTTLFDDGLADLDSVSYKMFHIVPFGGARKTHGVQLDGHIGLVRTFELDEFDGPLDLVDELNRLELLYREHDVYGDDADLVEWAGKMMTGNKQIAADNPQLYQYVPDDVPPVEEQLDPGDDEPVADEESA